MLVTHVIFQNYMIYEEENFAKNETLDLHPTYLPELTLTMGQLVLT